MDFSIYKKEQNVVISLKEHFDAKVSRKLKYIFDQLANKITDDVLVNLRPVLFMDSTGIGTIIHMHKILKAKQKRIFIIGAEGQPLGLLTMLKVNRVIPCLQTMDDYQIHYANTPPQLKPTESIAKAEVPKQSQEATHQDQQPATPTGEEETQHKESKKITDQREDNIEDLI
ncbi:STAS domain-containing protein [Spartinivicinus poritis]|uniref:STAS domain-containing protein n=1 Tax=Spartinivicinus poritis TaxID=2994640 RepID=A0ABT5U8E7_9GAMM|nr:STAS domain-containing protein [Spartinivicinus sp. A2-2]MDE1462649.1 STAS domain-containing protein [Spartinivicinus sp. A2-2]